MIFPVALFCISFRSQAKPQNECQEIAAELEALAGEKKKANSLRQTVDERDATIGSILKQLKASRAVQLEDEVENARSTGLCID